MRKYQVWFFTGLDEWPRYYDVLARCIFSAIAATIRDNKDVDVMSGFFVFEPGKGFTEIRQRSLWD